MFNFNILIVYKITTRCDTLPNSNRKRIQELEELLHISIISPFSKFKISGIHLLLKSSEKNRTSPILKTHLIRFDEHDLPSVIHLSKCGINTLDFLHDWDLSHLQVLNLVSQR